MNSNRRKIIEWLLNGTVFIVVIKIVHSYLNGDSLIKVQKPGKVYIGKTAELFTTKNYVITTVNEQPVMILQQQNQYSALLMKCTHADCTLHFAESQKTFLCSCHGGEFYLNGEVKTPPPQKPLTKLSVRKQDGEIWLLTNHI